jgi:nucleoside-diphosphate-sugar epimerase
VRVLVTGGTGYLGGALVRALARRGDDVVVLSRRAPRRDDAASYAGTIAHAPGDIRDRAAIEAAADGADAICHMAALVSLWRPKAREFDDVNIGGLRTVADVCRARGVARLVYTSSFLALPPAGQDHPLRANDYQRTKVDAALAAREMAQHVPIVTLYPGVIYGPGTATEGNLVGRLIADHLAGRLPGIVGGDRIWSFTYIDDVISAHVAALTLDVAGRDLIIGGENAPQVRLFEVLRDLTGMALPRRIPTALAYGVGAFEEVKARLTGRAPLLTRDAVTIFAHDWPLDGSPAARMLGYTITPLRTGLAATLPSLQALKQP